MAEMIPDDNRSEEQVLRDNNRALSQRNSAADAKVSAAFDVLAELPRARMSEKTFRTKYLKFMSPYPVPKKEIDIALDILAKTVKGKVSIDTLRTNLIQEWLRDGINDTGVPYNTPSHPVDVYGEDDTILFTVPPLMVSKKLDSNISAKIVSLSLMANAVFDNDRARGDAIVAQKIKPLIPKPEMDQATVDGWNIIYKYYDLPIYVPGKGFELEPTEKKTTNKEADFDNIFDFDD